MSANNQSIPNPYEVLGILATHWRRWLVPAVLLGVIAAVYATVSPSTWQASQALMIRNEATNSDSAQGKFSRSDEMKTVQETILELVKSRVVLAGALEEIGPPADSARQAAWPTDRDIDQLRQAVKLVPPKGAEFGSTEVFYLEVRDHDRLRTLAASGAIFRQLQAQFQQLRDLKAQSMIDELNKAAALARANLAESIARLNKIETHVGSDLAELRLLNDSTSNDGTLRRTAAEIESELRQTRSAAKANQQLLALLKSGQDDPGQLLATPGRLLESQPALRRLKDGLVDAQLRAAGLESRMSPLHPLVQSARQAEEEIGRQLHDELAIAIRGVEGDLRLNTDRVATLEKQLAQANERLSRLAGLRAAYSSQVAETASRTKLLERAEQNLAEAHATHASAKAASLLSCIDVPDAGIRPVSPSRAMIVLAGVAGGLLLGFGVVFLTVQAAPAKAAELRVLETSSSPPNGEATHSAPPLYPAAALSESDMPVFPSNGNLSLKQALYKISSGSRI